jgi:gamma-glutamyl hercynylcysteine S-oxide hydrolase
VCRHLAAVGGPDFAGLTATDLLFDAPHALVDQARTPKHQPVGRTNPDGWGVAWYPRSATPGATPEHYRTVTSIWDDGDFVTTARVIDCRTLVGAARLASPGLALASASNAPFVAGPWAFSLNGFVDGFRAEIGDELRAAVSPERCATLQSDTDSEVLFALLLDRIDDGREPTDALAAVMHFVTGITTGRLNLLLTDGDFAYGTRWGNSLFTRGPVVASEPLDDAPDWREIPDHSLVVVHPHGSEVTAL